MRQRQLTLFSATDVAAMRDRTKSRNHSPEREAFQRTHSRHRTWGKAQRHSERWRQLRASPTDWPEGSIWGPPALPPSARPDTPTPTPATRPKHHQPAAPQPTQASHTPAPPTQAPREQARQTPAPREQAPREQAPLRRVGVAVAAKRISDPSPEQAPRAPACSAPQPELATSHNSAPSPVNKSGQSRPQAPDGRPVGRYPPSPTGPARHSSSDSARDHRQLHELPTPPRDQHEQATAPAKPTSTPDNHRPAQSPKQRTPTPTPHPKCRPAGAFTGAGARLRPTAGNRSQAGRCPGTCSRAPPVSPGTCRSAAPHALRGT